jgi:NAD(P)-dependent dehydrogenase (short-subunit alcohol dehydrogenase family)
MARNKANIDIPNLRGKLALVTGASDGLGLEIARRLARAGAELILPVRNPRKGAAAVDRIAADAPNSVVSTRALDLASLRSVHELGEVLLSEGRPINIWVNNAGVMIPPTRHESEDGFELQFATNFLGHFALVGHALPLLKAGNAHMTTMSSFGSRNGKIDFGDLQSSKKYKPWPAYNQSKLALTLFAREFANRSAVQRWGVMSNVAHPGLTVTNLQGSGPNMGRESRSAMSRTFPWIGRHFPFLVQQVDTGALPAIYAATSPDAQNDTFYGPSGRGHLTGAPIEQKYYPAAENFEEANQLWAVAEDLAGVTLPISSWPTPEASWRSIKSPDIGSPPGRGMRR